MNALRLGSVARRENPIPGRNCVFRVAELVPGVHILTVNPDAERRL